jgi:hypothetical protein
MYGRGLSRYVMRGRARKVQSIPVGHVHLELSRIPHPPQSRRPRTCGTTCTDRMLDRDTVLDVIPNEYPNRSLDSVTWTW